MLRALTGLSFGKEGYSWRVPHCARCGARARRMGSLLHVLGFAWFLGAIFLALAITHPLSRGWAVVAALPLVVALSLPLMLWMVLFPPAVDVLLEDRESVFMFRDAGLYERFKQVNALDVASEPEGQT
jgi:hypothetical protein